MTITGLYSKAIKRWSGRGVDDRKAWVDFCAFMIIDYEVYEQMLCKGDGPTTRKEGWDDTRGLL